MRLEEAHGGESAEPAFVPFGGPGMALGKNEDDEPAAVETRDQNSEPYTLNHKPQPLNPKFQTLIPNGRTQPVSKPSV